MEIENAPVVEKAEEAVDELTYEYQPKDEEGRPLGGKQVVKGKTQQELLDNLAENNTRLQRELRKIHREQVLGDPAGAPRKESDDIPEGAERVNWAEYADPKPLTVEERLQLTHDLNDPAKVEAAQERLLQASPSYAEVRRNNLMQRAMAEGKAFSAAHPEYHGVEENNKALVSWCVKRNLALTKGNFEIAFVQLQKAGLLLEAPVAAGKPQENAPEPALEDGIIPEEEKKEEPAPQKRPGPTSSGLHNGNSSSSTRSAPAKKLTWADVDRMPQAEYDRKVRSDAAFRKAVDNLPPR